MTLTYDDRAKAWVASGNYKGRPYVAEGENLGEALRNGVILMNEMDANDIMRRDSQ